jgi:glycosyltransferase involved in cell wall biosynthesis
LKPRISVIINTYNEEANIQGCLECVKWADEIVVVDMYSTDRTVEIARRYTDKVLMHENVGYCEPARQFGIDNASHEWVFIVDADEYVPVALRRRIIRLLEEDRWDVIFVPRRNYFFGQPFSGVGCGPLQDMLPRVFRKPVLTWPTEVHALPEIPATARVHRLTDASCAMEHLCWVGVQDYLSRLSYLAELEGRNSLSSGGRPGIWKLAWLMWRDFVWRWLWKRGYKDGLRGMAIAAILASYQAMIAVNEQVMLRFGKDDPEAGVSAEYHTIVSRLTAEHREADRVCADDVAASADREVEA